MLKPDLEVPTPLTVPVLSQPKAVSMRAVLLGLFGTIFICAITPYNDYALNNTYFIGNNLPVGVITMTFLFVLLVNGPLHRWWPGQAFTASELSVSLGMMLVSCTLPSSGLMRYFAPAMVAPFGIAKSNRTFLDLLESMNLPRWAFPSFAGDRPSQWTNDPIVTGYMGRWTLPTMPPYLAWLRPCMTWGIFTFAMYGALGCMVTIARRQWFENERLAFPLAQIHLALIDQPDPGHVLSRILSRRSFWVAFGIVFFIRGWNGLAIYYPKFFPQIWTYYDVLRSIMTNPPWSYVDWQVKGAAVFFTALGVSYFLPGPVAFSIWFFYLGMQPVRMWLGTYAGHPDIYGINDQHFGGLCAFFLMVLWIGRRHWWMVIRQAFRGRRDGEPAERYLSYPLAFWTLIACWTIMVVWLVLAGCTVAGSMVMITLLLGLFMVITRIIAETGLIHSQLRVSISSPWQYAAMYGHPLISPLKTFYFSTMLHSIHYDFREVMPVYTTHAMKVADLTAFQARDSSRDGSDSRRTGRRILAALALALVVGYVVSFASTLWMEYKYAYTLEAFPTLPNANAVIAKTWSNNIDPVVQYAKNNYHPRSSPVGNWVFGFGFTVFLSFMRLRYAWWPMHPVGFLMLATYPTSQLWLSILIGWTIKSLILRFGGHTMYSNAKPFFLGLIVGDCVAAGFWLLVAMALNFGGIPYRAIHMTPG